jgi:hypothetical protein
MIRWRQFKYIRFRDAPPLMFNLATDPEEQCNLLERPLTSEEEAAREHLERLAQETIDFDQAEWERTVRDGTLKSKYAQEVPPSTGNLYLLPSGKLVNADDPLYNSTVIAHEPEEAFDDWPG